MCWCSQCLGQEGISCGTSPENGDSGRTTAELNNVDLQAADFSDIFTGRLISEIPQALRSLCTSLLHLTHLTSLDLSDNAFGGRSVEPM